MIYKLVSTAEWLATEGRRAYGGSADDRRDGFIHLSGRDQVVETAARHFAGRTGLTLLTVDPDRLGDDLRWEPSRGGGLFPHLYGPLPAHAVVDARAVPTDRAVADAVAALLD